jgi:hypothetical protein
MSSRRQRENDYLIQVKTLLGSALSSKDKSYLPYVGGDWLDAETVAGLQFILKAKPDIRESVKQKIDLALIYYEERRKAYFMTLGSDILTKLSYLVGESRNVRNANERINLPT